MRLVRHVRGNSRGDDQEGEEGDRAVPRPVLLGGPKTLHDLWQEYMFGGPVRKPAKEFTVRERGAVKHMY